jgi:hypothetical protein
MLIEEARAYLRKQLGQQELVALLRQTRRSDVPGVRYGESNQRLSYIVDALHVAFPQAQFIWLIRRGIEVVTSWQKRRRYQDGVDEEVPQTSRWRLNRIRGDEVGAMNKAEWVRMSAFAQTCWYWTWTNRKIQHDLALSGARWMVVKLEELDARKTDVAKFLGADCGDLLDVPVANRSKTQTTTTRWWDGRQRREFEYHCGELMDEFYPGWRAELALPFWQKFCNEALAHLSTRRATGRMLRRVGSIVPHPMLSPLRRALSGRGVLQYEEPASATE